MDSADNDTFFIHPVLSLVLKKNTSGDTELYGAGNGDSGYGNSDATGTNNKRGFKLIKTFDGEGWELLYQRQFTERVSSVYCIFIVNKKKKEVFAFGDNGRGGR